MSSKIYKLDKQVWSASYSLFIYLKSGMLEARQTYGLPMIKRLQIFGLTKDISDANHKWLQEHGVKLAKSTFDKIPVYLVELLE